MAEGHAVRHWAEQLRALIGEVLVLVQSTRRWAAITPSLAGQQVTQVAVRGKHLLIHVTGGMTIHCHAMMYGSWQVGPCGMELHKEPGKIRLRLTTGRHDAVFFNGPVVEFLSPHELREHPKLSALGPDILDEAFDPAEVGFRLRREPEDFTAAVVAGRMVPCKRHADY